jgi:hypothetical protein
VCAPMCRRVVESVIAIEPRYAPLVVDRSAQDLA